MYLFAINALTIKGSKLIIDRKKLILNNKLFPDLHLTANSTNADITYITKYSDWFDLSPDVIIINKNYNVIE